MQEAAVQGLALVKEMELTTQGTWTQAFEKWRAFFFWCVWGQATTFLISYKNNIHCGFFKTGTAKGSVS